VRGACLWLAPLIPVVSGPTTRPCAYPPSTANLAKRFARTADRDTLPDFLYLEEGGEFALLGQDELNTSVFENALRDQIVRSAAARDWPEQDTKRIILAAARVWAVRIRVECAEQLRSPMCLLRLEPVGVGRPGDAAGWSHQTVEGQLSH